MSTEEHSRFGDDLSQLLVRELAFPPVAGQVLAYLAVCDPATQTINELADALLASRSAITQAVTLLEERNLARRTRTRGERMDRVAAIFDATRLEYFDTSSFIEQARLIRQAIALLPADDDSGRRCGLEEVAALNEFFAEKYPTFKKEWNERLALLRAAKK
ncbi:MarR family transcriptional regulator [Paenibacillaceae bacterium]|nr:MarR family transcriptional regulator [Paenibacillaceae bacterium]